MCSALFSSVTPTYTSNCVLYFWVVVNLLDELSHVLTQCFTARPLTLSMAIERMGAGMFLMTVDRERQRERVKQMLNFLLFFLSFLIIIMYTKYTANKGRYFLTIRGKVLICHTHPYKHTHAKLTVATAAASIQPSESG